MVQSRYRKQHGFHGKPNDSASSAGMSKWRCNSHPKGAFPALSRDHTKSLGLREPGDDLRNYRMICGRTLIRWRWFSGKCRFKCLLIKP